jgi:hypothetical protein
MDKLEQYLDQVCRSIAGPRSLRQHVRQELREHLLDAAAAHKAAGMSEEAALARALEDFGGPEQVRSELEATHGHRLMGVVIDKAMQWQERTMKAKWLWMTWAYLAVVLLIALELLFICFNVVFLIPKYQKLRHYGIIDPAIDEEQGVGWMTRFLLGLSHLAGHYTTYLLLAAAAAWGLFEWRVKSENKSFIRLAVLGTVALALMLVVMLTSGSQMVQFYLGVPGVGKLARPWAVEQVSTIDASIGSLEQALAKKDWDAMQEQAEQASNAMNRLSAAPVVPSLVSGNESATVEERRAQVKEASEHLKETRQAIRDKDAERVEAALKKFHQAYQPVRDAAKRLEK